MEKFPFPPLLLTWRNLKKVPPWIHKARLKIRFRNFSLILSTLGEYLQLKLPAEPSFTVYILTLILVNGL